MVARLWTCPTTLEVLARNTDWLTQQVKAGNEAAKAVKRVVGRTHVIGAASPVQHPEGEERVDRTAEVADIREELAILIRDQELAGDVPMSEWLSWPRSPGTGTPSRTLWRRPRQRGGPPWLRTTLLPILERPELVLQVPA